MIRNVAHHRYALAMLLAVGGCQSPYHADQGALFGGLTGAGVGAVVGDALGNAGAGAAIGAGVGAVTGAAVGQSLDEIEARNRAQIAAQLGYAPPQGAVTIGDVVAMTKGGVSDALVVTHLQHHGLATPLRPADLIALKQQGVSDLVVRAMQNPAPRPMVAPAPGPPMIIEGHFHGPPSHPHCFHPPW